MLAAGLVVCENHESFPSLAEKIKKNFGFIFTAPGRSCYVLVYVSFISDVFRRGLNLGV